MKAKIYSSRFLQRPRPLEARGVGPKTSVRFFNEARTIFLELWQHPADGLAARAATALLTKSDELLNPLPGIDLGRVQVAVGIDADLVEPMELTGFAPAPPEPA